MGNSQSESIKSEIKNNTNNLDTLRKFLENNGNPNSTLPVYSDYGEYTFRGSIPLFAYACKKSNKSAIKLLLDHGANVRVKYTNGIYNLEKSICRNPDIFKYCIDNIKVVDREIYSNIDNIELFRYCIPKIKDIDTILLNPNIFTRYDFVKIALENGANPDIKNAYGKLPIELVNDLQVYKLLKANMDPDVYREYKNKLHIRSNVH